MTGKVVRFPPVRRRSVVDIINALHAACMPGAECQEGQRRPGRPAKCVYRGGPRRWLGVRGG